MENTDALPPPAAENVRLLIGRFDPTSADAESRYDEVVRRVNRTRSRRVHLEREKARLEAQFVDGTPAVLSGPRRGEPLSPAGRRRRLARLVDVGIELARVAEEERFASLCLDRMNKELDRWAKETYGG